MELSYIYEFVVLSRVLHFQEAADQLFISQSSLSKHIKSLETELGHDLFIRSKKKIALTEFGEAWLPYATQISDIQKDYTRNLLEKNPDDQTITIGYIPLVTLYTFMPFFTDFSKKYPRYQYSFLQDSEKNLMERLQQKQVDFILAGDLDLPEDQYYKRFYTCDKLMVILPENHPLAQKERLTLKEIQDETMIGLIYTESLVRTLKQSDPDFEYNPAIMVDKVSVLFDLITKNAGISILTNNMVVHNAPEGTVARELIPECIYEIYMIFPVKGTPSQITKSFAQYLSEQ